MSADRTVGREAAVKALKAFAQTDWTQLNEAFGETLFNETDRGAVILGATAVEDVLEGALRRRLVQLNADESARIFGPDAPLGSFSARVRMAHALGIIDREQRNMCDLLREMRNACAHSRRAISFENKELRDPLLVAFCYLTDEDLSEAGPEFYKLLLTWLCGWLARSIRTGSKEAASELIGQLVREAGEEAAKAAASYEKRRKRSSQGRQKNRKARGHANPRLDHLGRYLY